jgi:hypothetical protein
MPFDNTVQFNAGMHGVDHLHLSAVRLHASIFLKYDPKNTP